MFPYSKADKLSVQPCLIRILRRFVNLMLLLSVGLGNFVWADTFCSGTSKLWGPPDKFYPRNSSG